MRYISLDVETTGLDPHINQIIEIAAIIDDTNKRGDTIKNLPRFHALIKYSRYFWDEVALKMNWSLMEEILTSKNTMDVDDLAGNFLKFLQENNWNGKATFAGKNFGGFDKLFLNYVPCWKEKIPTHHRCFDPGSLYFRSDIDKEIPSLYECAKRIGIETTNKHRAMDDAEIVIALLRAKLP